MGSYDQLPSLVTELRQMKARVAELERQQLGVARAKADILANTNVTRATPTTTDPRVPTSEAVVPEMSIDLDPMGYPVVAFFSYSLLNPAAGWVQVATNLYMDGSKVTEAGRAVNIQGNSDIVNVSLICALSDPFWTTPGMKTYTIRWVISARQTTTDPAPYCTGVNRNFALLRVAGLT